MLAVFADEHVDPALLAAFEARGAATDSISRRGLQGLPDRDVLALAHAERRVLLTADTDFLAIAHERQTRQESFAPIIWWPQHRRTIGQLVTAIVPILRERDYGTIESQVLYV